MQKPDIKNLMLVSLKTEKLSKFVFCKQSAHLGSEKCMSDTLFKATNTCGFLYQKESQGTLFKIHKEIVYLDTNCEKRQFCKII